MDLLDLARNVGLLPKRMAATGGGEYESACPGCGGSKRFKIWPNQKSNNGFPGRYWCRECECKGDAIQFCRDFLSLSYPEACRRLNVPTTESSSSACRMTPPTIVFEKARYPSMLWQNRATAFVDWCHHQLLKNQSALELVRSRGLTEQSIAKFKLGYCPSTFKHDRLDWGLPLEYHPDGTPKPHIWIPRGIVIPTLGSEGKAVKLEIRRQDWREGDKVGKYIKVTGSIKAPSVIGNIEAMPSIIMESWLDAMLVHQIAGDLCACVALGGLGNKRNLETHNLLLKCPRILFALDFDESGTKAYRFWKTTYPNLIAWPVPKTKGPGDAYKAGVDLRSWITIGLKQPVNTCN